MSLKELADLNSKVDFSKLNKELREKVSKSLKDGLKMYSNATSDDERNLIVEKGIKLSKQILSHIDSQTPKVSEDVKVWASNTEELLSQFSTGVDVEASTEEPELAGLFTLDCEPTVEEFGNTKEVGLSDLGVTASDDEEEDVPEIEETEEAPEVEETEEAPEEKETDEDSNISDEDIEHGPDAEDSEVEKLIKSLESLEDVDEVDEVEMPEAEEAPELDETEEDVESLEEDSEESTEMFDEDSADEDLEDDEVMLDLDDEDLEDEETKVASAELKNEISSIISSLMN